MFFYIDIEKYTNNKSLNDNKINSSIDLNLNDLKFKNRYAPLNKTSNLISPKINLSLDDLVFKDKYITLNKLSNLNSSKTTSSDISISKVSDENTFNLISTPLIEKSINKLIIDEDNDLDNIKNNDKEKNINSTSINSGNSDEKIIIKTNKNKRKHQILESDSSESGIFEFNLHKLNSTEKSNDQQLNLNQQNNHQKINQNSFNTIPSTSKEINSVNRKKGLEINSQNHNSKTLDSLSSKKKKVKASSGKIILI